MRARSGVVRAPSTSKVGRRRADVAGHHPCPRLHRCGTRSRAASPTIGLHSCEHVAARGAWACSRQRSASELSADARAGAAAAARARLTLRQHPAQAPAPERRCRLLLPLCSASEHADSSREMTGHVHDLQPITRPGNRAMSKAWVSWARMVKVRRQTIGQEWQKKCARLPSLERSARPVPAPAASNSTNVLQSLAAC